MKHVIGIDFGTSTSMIKTAVRDGKTDSLETRPVIFTQKDIASVPTLIRKRGCSLVWLGCGSGQRPGCTLYRNFKLSLRSENSGAPGSVELLEEFFVTYISPMRNREFSPWGRRGD